MEGLKLKAAKSGFLMALMNWSSWNTRIDFDIICYES